MKTTPFTFFLILMPIFVWTAGCDKQKPDPLADWKPDFNPHLNRAIVDDYNKYIQQLPPNQRALVNSQYSIEPLENGAGGHAVKIEIPLNGTFFEHVLIYDQNNRRIKTLKYSAGHYQS